jgi:hypothetical protein
MKASRGYAPAPSFSSIWKNYKIGPEEKWRGPEPPIPPVATPLDHNTYLLFTNGVFIFTIITDDNTPLTFILLMIFKTASCHDDVAVRIWTFHVFKFTLFNMVLSENANT